MAFNIYESIMDGNRMAQQGAERGKQSKLSKLASQAYGLSSEQAAPLIQEATATDADAGYQIGQRVKNDENTLLKQAAGAASYMLSAWKTKDQNAIQGAWQSVRPFLEKTSAAHGGPAPPDSFDESMLPNIHKVLAAAGATSGEDERGILANDGNIVDPRTGKIIYQGSPKPQYEIVTDPQTGQVYRIPKTPGAAEQVMLGGQPQASNQQPMTGGAAGVTDDAYANAIAGIESAGSGDYSALGPATKNGDRALGRYQVMGENIPQWTMAALGKSMSPQEYLVNPQAQDAVFKHRFGEYVKKYGPEGAAKAWFAGEGGMKNPNAKDSLGTSVAEYGQKFMAGLGGQQSSGGQPLRMSPKVEKNDSVRTLSSDEVKAFGLPAGSVAQVDSNGKISVVSKPEKPAGQLTPQQQLKADQTRRKENQSRLTFNSSADEDVKMIDDLLKSDLTWVTGIGKFGASIPGTRYADTKAMLDRLTNRGAFSTLAEMRANSPTGGALGAVSDRENQMLASSAATLSTSQSPEALKKALLDYKKKILQSKTRINTSFSDFYSGGGQASPAPSANDDISDLLEQYK